jgi:hypothetical protein
LIEITRRGNQEPVFLSGKAVISEIPNKQVTRSDGWVCTVNSGSNSRTCMARPVAESGSPQRADDPLSKGEILTQTDGSDFLAAAVSMSHSQIVDDPPKRRLAHGTYGREEGR